MTRKKKGTVSEETFDDFLAEQVMLEACENPAIKELIADQLVAAMKEQGLSKVEMAARMKTSRAALNRLLDETDTSLTLATLASAAAALGKRLSFELVPA